ncbi:MAG TPA: T9SS type A sorting domain-containing protein [Puia sp.]
MTFCLLGPVLRAQTLGTNIIANGDAENIILGSGPGVPARLASWIDMSDLSYPIDPTGATGGVWFLPNNSTYPVPSHGANQAHGGSYFFNAGINSNPGSGETAQLQQNIDLTALHLDNTDLSFSFIGYVATDGNLPCCDGDLVNIRIEYLAGTDVKYFYDPQYKAANSADVGWNSLIDIENIMASDGIDNINIILQAENDNSTSTIQAYYDDISLIATTPLPVTLVDFHALQQPDHTVALQWETAQEQNSRITEVQRSADGRTFATIGQVAAAGNSSLPKYYEFTDKSPLSGRGYYRLKMIDLDGSFKYSKVLLVSTGVTGTAIKVYSNPFHDQLGVMIPSTTSEKLVLSLFDQTGKMCMRQNYTTQKGDNFVNLYPGGMAAGVYLLHIQGAQTNQTIRVLKQ